jgi:hypothetical protein
MVEHLLPSLLGLYYTLSQELQERNLFFGELSTALEALRDRFTVISSPPRGTRKDSQYPWLWRYVSHFNVGSETRAVQHAKLWAYHWKLNGKEALELYVSSTNLTSSAFRSQLQAGWHAMLLLKERATPAALQTWGELIPFLKALGASAGAVAAVRLERLISLLRRAECPADVTFVASVPGSKGSKSAARQLAKFKPSEIHILTPTIGEWNERTLADWSADVGFAPNKIHLKWISDAHPWAANTGWALSKAASENLQRSGVRLECLPKETRFTDQHRDGDPRWSHAKLYLLRSGRKRRLLVTSANWSAAAWGAGRFAPRNFELGVVFESEWTDLEVLGERFDPPQTVPFCVDCPKVEERVSTLEWAEASWDGKHIVLRVRSTDPVTAISAVVTFAGSLERSILLTKSEASMAWNDMNKTPLAARFMQGAEVLEVDIVDFRSPSEFAKTPLPEVDPASERDLREAFLLQRYGGQVVDPESIPGLGGGRGPNGSPPPPSDYAVQAWIEARAAFAVVDRWRAALEEAAGDTLRREQIYMDGKELRALFARREDPWAPLVAEELGWHLSEEA